MSTPVILFAPERLALSRLRQILNSPPAPFLRASFVKMKHPCGRSSCRCSRDKKFWHLSWYISQSLHGKPRMKSVPKEQLPDVRQWIERYQEAKKLLADIGTVSWGRVGKGKKRKR